MSLYSYERKKLLLRITLLFTYSLLSKSMILCVFKDEVQGDSHHCSYTPFGDMSCT